MLLTTLIVVWAVAVLGATAFAGLRGWSTYAAARRLQRAITPHLAAIQGAGMGTLEARTAELHGRVELLQATLARLNAGLAVLRLLVDAWRAATQPLSLFRGLLRR